MHTQDLSAKAGCLLSCVGVLLVCGLGIGVMSYLLSTWVPLPLAVGLTLLLFAGVCLFFLSPSLLPAEQRRRGKRQAALHGNTSLLALADPQPIPNETVLTPPWTMRLVPDWRGITLWLGMVAFLTCACITAGLVIVGGISALDWPTLLLLVVGSFGTLALVALVDSPWIRTTITLSEEGMFVRGFGKQPFMTWQQVRLFAIAADGKAGSPVWAYELADLNTTVRIRRLQRSARLQVLKPQTTFETYDQQMDVLLSFIAAKTHLPLYDLRA